MKKFMVLLLFILAITLSMLLKWQWHAFSSSLTEGIQTVADQKVQIVSDAKSLNIKQSFSGLDSKNEFELIIPDLVLDWECETESGDPCPSNDQNPNTFLPVNGVIQIVYSIPLDRNQPYTLIMDWKMQLRDVHIQYSTVSITETFYRNGIWIVGLPLRGQNQLDLIDFFSFAGEGDFNSLYFQNKPFKLQNRLANLAIYADGDNKKQLNFPLYNQLPEKSYLALVFTDFQSNSSSDIILIKPNQSQNIVEKSLINTYFQQKVEGNLDWLVEILVSFHMNELPKGTKAKDGYHQLTNVLTPEEFEEFIQKISNNSEQLNEQELDGIIKDIKGLETKFFQRNVSTKIVSPLYFFESKMVTIENGKPSNIEMIYKDGKRLYPMNKLVTKMGYHVEQTSDELHLERGVDSYQFNLKQNLFTHNGQNYGLLENPLFLIDNEYHMEQNWLQTIFKVTMEDVEGTLNIKEELR